MKNSRKVISSYLRLWHWHGKRIFLYGICAILNGASMYLLMQAIGVLLSGVTQIAAGSAPENTISTMIIFAAIAVAVAVLSGFLPVALTYLQEKAGNSLRMDLLRSRSSTRESEIGNISDSDVFLRINDDLPQALDTIGTWANMVYFNPIISGFFSCITIGILDWRLGMFTLLFAIVVCAPLGIIRRNAARLQREIQTEKSHLAQQFSDTINGAEEIRVFGLKHWIFGKISRVSRALCQKQTKYWRWFYGRIQWFCLDIS